MSQQVQHTIALECFVTASIKPAKLMKPLPVETNRQYDTSDRYSNIFCVRTASCIEGVQKIKNYRGPPAGDHRLSAQSRRDSSGTVQIPLR